MQVKRYFHIRANIGLVGGSYKPKFKAATVLVTGNTQDPAQVDVQVTFCSRKDVFEKKIGRAQAEQAKVKIVPLRYLPNELDRIEKQVTGLSHAWNEYLFAIRYFLPKE